MRAASSDSRRERASAYAPPSTSSSICWIHGLIRKHQIALPEAWDLHARHSPNHPLFKYVTAAGVQKTITWLTGVQAFHRISKFFPPLTPQVYAAAKGPTIGILATAGTLYPILVSCFG